MCVCVCVFFHYFFSTRHFFRFFLSTPPPLFYFVYKNNNLRPRLPPCGSDPEPPASRGGLYEAYNVDPVYCGLNPSRRPGHSGRCLALCVG